MPSPALTHHEVFAKKATHHAHVVFYPLLFLTFVLWLLYRSLFQFPIWFDEVIGKALFFGLPVWIYATIAGSHSVTAGFSPQKMQPGILLGLAVGGVFGFITSLLMIFTRSAQVEAALLFTQNSFWSEFILALFTAFWETILFYNFVLTVAQEKYPEWSDARHALFAACIFLVFHIPNTFLRFMDGPEAAQTIFVQLAILFLFALGQAYLYIGRRNSYALVLSHALWGLVLLVHTW